MDQGRDSRLVYELEVPQEPGNVQKEFSIEKTGSFIISIKVQDALHILWNRSPSDIPSEYNY